MHVMVCGGAGYIGSHTCVALHERGHDITIVDNFSSSSPHALQRLERLLGHALDTHCLDIRDGTGLAALFSRRRYDAVVHLAALTSAVDARERPLAYFDNNIAGTITLLRRMREAGVGQLVFSSSAIADMADSAGFSDAACAPLAEDTPPSCANPYGRTAAVVEQLIGDVCAADPGLRALSLRYFHAVGAHASGLIGDATGTMSSAAADSLQAICQTAAGLRECVQIYGDDWPTIDGTCVRDFLHVMDLARAHADAVDALCGGMPHKGAPRTGMPQDDVLETEGGHRSINLGRGGGISVLQLLRTFEAVSGRSIPYRVLARRVGDVAEIYADPGRAEAWLGWRAELGVEEICRDTWHRQSMRSNGTIVGEP
jgi:UDP-glucose 4-epimerase